MPSYAALGGWAAAYWCGVRLLDGRRDTGSVPVLLCLGAEGKLRRSPGIRLSRARLREPEIVSVRGAAVTSPARTALDGARFAPSLVEAVVFLDMMFSSGLLSPDDFSAYLEHCSGLAGVGKARNALSHADPAAASPPETRLRLLWTLSAKLPPPRVNQPVFSVEGQLLGYPDVFDPEAATAGEYDGEDHRDLRNHTSDNIREESLEEHGVVVARVTAVDLRRPTATAQRLARAWRRGMARDVSRDRWTLEQPAWFVRRVQSGTIRG